MDFERVARGTDLVAEGARKAARVDVLGLDVYLETVLPAGAVGAVGALEGAVHHHHLGPYGVLHVEGGCSSKTI